ncbi:MAG TPA: ankyrin repeat domain-containing protein [Bryobacteraceae bacterium]|nr:ankyrin repeat domain-containing protein [Bryobacteraceae bacterium]
MYRCVCLVLATALLLVAGDVNEDLLNAARKGDLDTVKALIDKGAPVEAKTPYGQTPLYLAAMSGHDAVVQYLLEKGAKTDITDTFYKASILIFVLERKHYSVAKMLIAKGSGKVDDELKEVADTDQTDLVQAVIQKGQPSQKVLDAIYEGALDRKKTAVAELLKKAGAHEPPPAVAVDAKVLESYAGTYKTEQIPLDIKVFVKEGKLYLQATGQDSFSPKPKSATVYEYREFGVVVEFDSASSFTLKQGGGAFKFKKAVAQ